jgi:hypothetical protein
MKPLKPYSLFLTILDFLFLAGNFYALVLANRRRVATAAGGICSGLNVFNEILVFKKVCCSVKAISFLNKAAALLSN